jgi:hypothetical protein
LAFLFTAGCAGKPGIRVPIKPVLDKQLKEVQPLTLHAGLLIEPSLRHFSQEERQIDMIAGIHHYIFPIGEPLARNLEEAVRRVFDKVTILQELPNHETIEKTKLEVLIIVQLDSSKLELLVEESVWRAVGKHYLSVCVSLLDKNLHKVFEDRIVAEGKSLDLIDFETEGGWWKTAGPKYGPAAENSIEKIVFQLAERLNFFGKKMINK